MNKTMKTTLVLSIFFILAHCSGYKEPAPFKDGMYLEYMHPDGSPESYKIEAIGSKGYKIVETLKGGPVSFDNVKEMFVDIYGMVYKSSFEPYEGGFSPIWIPVNKFKVGDAVPYAYTHTRVARKDRWKKWEVLVLEGDIGGEYYYDLKTGFSVGLRGRGVEVILVNTNAPGLTVD